MSILTVVVTLAMVLWAVWFVASGLAFAVRLLRHPPTGEGLVPARIVRRIGAVLLVGVLGVLVATVLLTAALVTERASPLAGIDATLTQWEAKARQHETGLRHGLSLLRHRLAG